MGNCWPLRGGVINLVFSYQHNLYRVQCRSNPTPLTLFFIISLHRTFIMSSNFLPRHFHFALTFRFCYFFWTPDDRDLEGSMWFYSKTRTGKMFLTRLICTTFSVFGLLLSLIVTHSYYAFITFTS
ncbi:hypothetical protein KSF78_0000768 [Schistosoma japonicum]|nr:hypothetical protein KSF78_0000768 [Schistosoma japonicum]